MIDCDEGDNTDDKSGQTVQEESDYYHNQTFDVYDQEIALVGTECENTTEKLHSQGIIVFYYEYFMDVHVCYK